MKKNVYNVVDAT